MSSRGIRHIIVIGMAVMLLSCARDHLYYDAKSRDLVQLNIDWSQTEFMAENVGYNRDNPLNGVTVIAFDANTQQLAKELPPDGNWRSPRISLDPGVYNLIVINDSRVELPNINFSTDCGYSDFNAYIAVDTIYSGYPDYLTVSNVKGVAFQQPYRDYFYDQPDGYIHDIVTQEIATEQHPVTKRVNISAYVKGINYCRGMQPSYITGLSRSVNLATETPGVLTTVFAFNLVNREYRGNDYTEALLTQTFNSYSFNRERLLSGEPFELTLNFVLVNNSVHSVKVDVTDQIEKWLDEHITNGNLYDDLDIYLELALPPTDPSSSDAEGFVPETLPWNDITQEIIM